MSHRPIFHLAFPVHDLAAARKFYVEGLGCRPGRMSEHSLILYFAGHQIVAQKIENPIPAQKGIYPRHFGLVFSTLAQWRRLVRRAEKHKLRFYQSPKVRFADTPLEHHTCFLQDPSGNLLEFKHYSKPSAIFGQRSQKKVGDRSLFSLPAVS